MAAKMILVLIFAIVVVAVEATLSPATKKSIDDLTLYFQNVTDAINTATPPANKVEAARSSAKHIQAAKSHVAKAAEAGDEKKVADLILRYTIASSMAIAAPPSERLRVMEDAFNSAGAPDPLECPNIDKAYCETRSKIHKAAQGVVLAAASAQEKLVSSLTKDSTLSKIMHAATSRINQAYADGDDDKQIARVLAAYNKAADSVIAAPPSDKLKVMESTFKHAAATLQ